MGRSGGVRGVLPKYLGSCVCHLIAGRRGPKHCNKRCKEKTGRTQPFLMYTVNKGKVNLFGD